MKVRIQWTETEYELPEGQTEEDYIKSFGKDSLYDAVVADMEQDEAEFILAQGPSIGDVEIIP